MHEHTSPTTTLKTATAPRRRRRSSRLAQGFGARRESPRPEHPVSLSACTVVQLQCTGSYRISSGRGP